ncbi:hypothetical protein J4207_06070 [Candidatus Woesearchaeota archaeon]|nr:hypothetical protein [Candidatus Woesearchaeota archaeon]HLC80861.1 hypothetical protein [Candidatus Nanoarchaeia archaeon]
MDLNKTYLDSLRVAGRYVLYGALAAAAVSSLYAGYNYVKERNLHKAEEYCLKYLKEYGGSLEDLTNIPSENLLLLAPPGYNLSCEEIFRMLQGQPIFPVEQEKAEQQSL